MSEIYCGDAAEVLRTLPPESVNMCVTSPPYYGLRDYGESGQIGIEKTPAEYIARLVVVFEEVRRVLSKDGTLWVNIGDSYAGSGKGPMSMAVAGNGKNKELYQKDSRIYDVPKTWDKIKPKDLIGIPWLLAFALRESGWYLLFGHYLAQTELPARKRNRPPREILRAHLPLVEIAPLLLRLQSDHGAVKTGEHRAVQTRKG